MRLQIRRVQLDQADRLAGEREIKRPDIKVGQLFGRKEREPPPSRNYAGEVLRQVPMRRRARPVAEPQRDQRRTRHVEHRHWNGRQQARHVPPDRDSAGVHRIGFGASSLSQKQVEQLIDGRRPPLVVEPAEIVVVAEAPLDLRRSEPGLERFARCRAPRAHRRAPRHPASLRRRLASRRPARAIPPARTSPRSRARTARGPHPHIRRLAAWSSASSAAAASLGARVNDRRPRHPRRRSHVQGLAL